VEPTQSQKRTVTVFLISAAAASVEPQLGQNRAPAGVSAPHLPQTAMQSSLSRRMQDAAPT
jgi:hypothetical protein